MKSGECKRIEGCILREEIDDLPDAQKNCMMSYTGNIHIQHSKDQRGYVKDNWCITSGGSMRCGGGALCCSSGVPVIGYGYSCSSSTESEVGYGRTNPYFHDESEVGYGRTNPYFHDEDAVGMQVQKIMDCYRNGGTWKGSGAYAYCSHMEAK